MSTGGLPEIWGLRGPSVPWLALVLLFTPVGAVAGLLIGYSLLMAIRLVQTLYWRWAMRGLHRRRRRP